MLPSTRAHQGGQALTEFLAAAVVLVPLFVLMPMIGKYQDIAHSTLMASRYVAFDATVRNDSLNSWKPEAQVAQEVRRRFFGRSQTPIKTDDAIGDFTADRNALWVDPLGNPLIAQFDRDVNVSYGPGKGPKHTDAFTGAGGYDYRPFQGHSRFNLPARGIYNANVSVALANLPTSADIFKPFDNINLTLTQSTAVMFDSWSARNADDVKSRLRNPIVNPAIALAPLQPVVDLAVQGLDGYLIFHFTGQFPDPRVGRLSNIRGPKLGDLDFWQDVVHPDRLR